MPRQTDCGFFDAVTEALARHDIGHVIWQRDPHDDLWGWDAPELRRRITATARVWTDLGALPRWPDGCDLSGLPLVGKRS
ncbi:hypothetical protein [Paracoccus sp. (in: a-proteobacteria)]|uniref:hypothetical protein n=1 Tax=Paracoccus sp. TaxID=267 RepID=UPI003A88A478